MPTARPGTHGEPIAERNAVGVPQLMMSCTADGHMDAALVAARDKRLGDRQREPQNDRNAMAAPAVAAGAEAVGPGHCRADRRSGGSGLPHACGRCAPRMQTAPAPPRLARSAPRALYPATRKTLCQ